MSLLGRGCWLPAASTPKGSVEAGLSSRIVFFFFFRHTAQSRLRYSDSGEDERSSILRGFRTCNYRCVTNKKEHLIAAVTMRACRHRSRATTTTTTQLPAGRKRKRSKAYKKERADGIFEVRTRSRGGSPHRNADDDRGCR